VLDANTQKQLIDKLQSEMDNAMAKGCNAVLLCGTQLRLPLRRLMDKYLPLLSVVAYNEVAQRADVEFVGQIRAA